ncbi:MAG: hypothetical protein IPL84_17220 [Chitinophagaceae bacterium]|nr:hypothetical protein [Chitinophagaceae bacterium]
MRPIDFKEVQRFRVWWAWLGVAALNAVGLMAIVQQVLLKKSFGPEPAPDYVLILVELVFLLVLFFLISIKLKTRLTDDGMYYRFYPFQFKEKHIAWHELKDAYIRQYNSLHEYGGWGIRIGGKKTGDAVNTSASSNRGLQLQFTDGKLLLIGTTRPDELQMIIDEVLSSGKINRAV